MELFKEHEIKSPYDLREMLWYIIPGATLLLLIFLFEYWFSVEIRGVELSYKNGNKTSENIVLNKSDETVKIEFDTKSKNEQTDTMKQKSNTISADSSGYYKKQLLENVHTPVFTALTITHTGENMFGENWVFGAIYLLLLLSVCYVLGHISYMAGTFLYERFLIMKGYSYPYKKLLLLQDDEKHKNQREIDASQGFYTGVWFWIAFIFLIAYILGNSIRFTMPPVYTGILLFFFIFFLIIPAKLKFELSYLTRLKIENRRAAIANTSSIKTRPDHSGYLFWPLWTILFIIIMYVLNHSGNQPLSPEGFWEFVTDNIWIILAVTAPVVLITEWVIRKISRTEWAANGSNQWLSKTEIDLEIEYDSNDIFDREKVTYETIFIKLYNFLGYELDRFSNNYFHTQAPFDKIFRDKYNEVFQKVYSCNYQDLKTHNYWFSKMFVMENSQYLSQQINFWENASRFTKSLSASFFIACVYCSFSYMIQCLKVRESLSHLQSVSINYPYRMSILFFIPLGYFILTALFVRYYLYVYDNRFNRLILRSFVALTLCKEFNKKEKPEIKIISDYSKL